MLLFLFTATVTAQCVADRWNHPKEDVLARKFIGAINNGDANAASRLIAPGAVVISPDTDYKELKLAHFITSRLNKGRPKDLIYLKFETDSSSALLHVKVRGELQSASIYLRFVDGCVTKMASNTMPSK
ncbi:hypothetical protein [Sphingomonas sp. 28-62-11]|uniref:hypothetical protein n=1 Tax=Sphingomonas sp. 28-62-11 TaxID=1970432 RepID=UPI0035A8CDF3